MTDAVLKKFSSNMKRLRLEKGLTMGQLALEASISKTTISQLESNKTDNISLYLLMSISNVLGDFSWLSETFKFDTDENISA